MNADYASLYLMKSGAVLKNQSYYGPSMPSKKLIRKTMKSNGAQELPLGGMVCDCPKGDSDPECCINKLGLKSE